MSVDKDMTSISEDNKDTKQYIIELLQRTVDREDPDRQYIGFLADKIVEVIQHEKIEHGKRLFMAIRDVWSNPPTQVVEHGSNLYHWDKSSILNSLDTLQEEYERIPFIVTEKETI